MTDTNNPILELARTLATTSRTLRSALNNNNAILDRIGTELLGPKAPTTDDIDAIFTQPVLVEALASVCTLEQLHDAQHICENAGDTHAVTILAHLMHTHSTQGQQQANRDLTTFTRVDQGRDTPPAGTYITEDT